MRRLREMIESCGRRTQRVVVEREARCWGGASWGSGGYHRRGKRQIGCGGGEGGREGTRVFV